MLSLSGERLRLQPFRIGYRLVRLRPRRLRRPHGLVDRASVLPCRDSSLMVTPFTRDVEESAPRHGSAASITSVSETVAAP
jgi:hypothetical protein